MWFPNVIVDVLFHKLGLGNSRFLHVLSVMETSSHLSDTLAVLFCLVIKLDSRALEAADEKVSRI